MGVPSALKLTAKLFYSDRCSVLVNRLLSVTVLGHPKGEIECSDAFIDELRLGLIACRVLFVFRFRTHFAFSLAAHW